MSTLAIMLVLAFVASLVIYGVALYRSDPRRIVRRLRDGIEAGRDLRKMFPDDLTVHRLVDELEQSILVEAAEWGLVHEVLGLPTADNGEGS